MSKCTHTAVGVITYYYSFAPEASYVTTAPVVIAAACGFTFSRQSLHRMNRMQIARLSLKSIGTL